MMEFTHHWNFVNVAMNEYGTLDTPDLIYTEGLGPCVGMCLAYNHWAGIIHSSFPPHDEEEIRELISLSKEKIPKNKLHEIRPILCGAAPDDIDPDDIALSKKTILNLLEKAGFGDAIEHWSTDYETAAIFADLMRMEVHVEIDDQVFSHDIPQN